MSTQSHKKQLLPLKNRVIPVDQNTSFLAHYDTNENDVLRDIQPYGYRNSLGFNATSNQGVQTTVPPITDGTTLTLEAWIYPTGAPTGDRGCIIINRYYLTLDSSYKVGAYWYGRTPAGYHASNATISLNTWTHVAAVWDASNLYIYINGALDVTIACTGTGETSSTTTLNMGSEGITSRWFNGQLSDLRIWNVARTQKQIQDSMNQGLAGNEKGLISYWKMNEGTGGVVYDSSATGGSTTVLAGNWKDGRSIFTLLPQEGYYGGGIAVEESTTNVAIGELTPYTPYNTMTRDGQNLTFKMVDGGAQYLTVHNGTDYNGQIITLSGILKKNGMPYKLPGDRANTYHTVPAIKWYFDPKSGYFEIVENCNASSIWLFHTPAGTGAGDVITIDKFQVEVKPFATSFVNGSRPSGLLYYPQELYNFNEGTFSCWARTHTVAAVKRIFFQWDTTGSGASHFGLEMIADGRILFRYGVSGGSYNDMYSTASYNDGKWHHYAITWKDGSNEIYLYVDGVRVASAIGPTTMQNSGGRYGGKIPLGHSGWSYENEHWNGIIDEVRIDKVARSADEILAWYHSNSPFWPKGIYNIAY